ncbi:MAG: hypothetical protein MUP11_06975 [Anaerolineales bacterium]|nr:hypothetical protein [Anaerolineales bacterium]
MVVVISIGLTACLRIDQPHSRDLQLEEYPLAAAPNLVPLTFQPEGTTQDAVLARHALMRDRVYANPIMTIEGYPVMTSLGEGEILTAVTRVAVDDPFHQIVDLMRGDELIFSTYAGLPSPSIPQQGLWTYDNHWVLEILLSEDEIWIGEIFQDGELINDLKEYEEAFGFQLLSGEPFFFYQRDGQLGFSYAGQETNLPYDQIPHYYCCGEDTINPVQAERMVSFFAQQGENWFYVELGDFIGNTDSQ